MALKRYMTALDVAQLLYSPSSLTYVRSLLSELAGGTDFKTNQYLYRFKLPSTSTSSTRIYTLGSKGRNFLANEIGLPVDWYFRPYKLKYLSYSQVVHNLSLTRFLIAAQAWAAKQSNFRIAQTRICYQLSEIASMAEINTEGKTERLKVIPDAWVLFERLTGGVHERFMPVLLELDRGTEHGQKFKKHLGARIAFIKGAYSKMFGTRAVIVAYATTGELPEYRETRRKAMCAWTMEVLADLHMETWSSIFRFASVVFDELYTSSIFDEPVWYRPDSPSPVPLFTPLASDEKVHIYGQ